MTFLCGDVDVAAWLQANRVPLYTGKKNRWVLLRTSRDNPDEGDLQDTLQAVFVKWFEQISWSPNVLTSDEPIEGGPANNIQLVDSSKTRLRWPKTVKRREDLDVGPIPLVSGPHALWLQVEFDYRGAIPEMAWPVWTARAVQTREMAQCPVDADWALDSVAEPAGDAAPQRGAGEHIAETVSKTVETPLQLALFGAGVVGGLYVTSQLARLTRGLGSSKR